MEGGTKQYRDWVELPIDRVDVFGVAVPLSGPGYANAYVTKTVQKSVVVRLLSRDGAVGLGNIDRSPGYSLESVDESLAALRGPLMQVVRGLDAGNPHRVIEVMDAQLRGFLDAKAAIEMACVDMTARNLGIAVHQYLGGAVVDELSFNAWIGMMPPGEAAAEARKWFDRGFRSAKIKIGSGPANDCDRVGAVREAVGPDMHLRADANAAYDAESAIAVGRMLERFDLQLLEQPVPADDRVGMARVRSIGIPVMADETTTDHASLIAVIRANCADVVKLKAMKQGGLLRCRRMIDTATAAGLRVVIGHGFGLGINTMAEIMLASTSRSVMEGLECVGPLKTSDDVVTAKLYLGSGHLDLPQGPGLGVELYEEKVSRYAYAGTAVQR
jgi:muconate cycloisomerase